MLLEPDRLVTFVALPGSSGSIRPHITQRCCRARFACSSSSPAGVPQGYERSFPTASVLSQGVTPSRDSYALGVRAALVAGVAWSILQ